MGRDRCRILRLRLLKFNVPSLRVYRQSPEVIRVCGGGPNYHVAGSIDETGTNKDARQINGSSGGPSSVRLQLTTCFTVQTVH